MAKGQATLAKGQATLAKGQATLAKGQATLVKEQATLAKKPTILIDLNILLDVLQKREPFYETSAGILAAVETGRVEGYVAAHSLTTLFYLVQKDKSSAEARGTITSLLQFIKVAPADQSTIEQALALDYRDFEDSVQMISAVQCKVECLITRNVKDYQPALLPVVQPVDFLGTI